MCQQFSDSNKDIFFLFLNVDNPGNITVINPEITCTDPDDVIEPEEGSRTPTQDDDIDQAFACYERDHPSGQTKTLPEQLNILTMVSEITFTSYSFHSQDLSSNFSRLSALQV